MMTTFIAGRMSLICQQKHDSRVGPLAFFLVLGARKSTNRLISFTLLA